MKHSPGPWIMKGNYPEDQAIIYDEATGTNIAVVYTGDGGNAHLITAAPDLLETLAWTLEQLNTLTTDAYSKGGDREIRDRLQETISKATP